MHDILGADKLLTQYHIERERARLKFQAHTFMSPGVCSLAYFTCRMLLVYHDNILHFDQMVRFS